MKKVEQSIFIIIFMLCAFQINAQQRDISFSVANGADKPDQVKVINTTKSITIILQGNDVLRLMDETTSVNTLEESNQKIMVYPNPVNDYSRVNIISHRDDILVLSLYDSQGKQIINQYFNVQEGKNSFSLQGLMQGIYILNASSSEASFSETIISTQSTNSLPEMKHVSNTPINQIIFNKSLEQNEDIIELAFSQGDVLKITAFYNDQISNVYLSPETDQNVDFEEFNDFISDVDGNVYPTVTIGSQEWMAENLRVLSKPDGTPINYGAHSYNNDDSYIETYGLLYQWQAVMDSDSIPEAQGICPSGWHIPSDIDWKTLESELGMNENQLDIYGWRGTDEGAQLAGHHELWDLDELVNNPNFNTSGFEAKPSGYRYNGMDGEEYTNIGEESEWWSSTSGDLENSAISRMIFRNSSKIYRHESKIDIGKSVRCIKD